MTERTHIKERMSGRQLFWRTVVYTVAAVALIALGFFGAMAVSGVFA